MKTDLNWDVVKNTLDELTNEIDSHYEFNVEEFSSFTNFARNNLMDMLEMNHDGYPYTEMTVDSHSNPIGIPVSLANIMISCLAFAKFSGIDAVDAIKTRLEK